MQKSFSIAAVLFCLPALHCSGAESRQPQTPPSAAAAPAQGRMLRALTAPDPGPQVVLLDLAALPTDAQQTLNAPRGEFFRVQLDNTVPFGIYRVTADLSLSPTSPKPPARAMHMVMDLRPSPPLKPYDFRHPTYSACRGLIEHVSDVLQTNDEPTIAVKMKSLLDSLIAPECHSLVPGLMAEHFLPGRTQLQHTYYLGPTDNVSLKIERLHPDTKAALRTWNVVLGAGTLQKWRDKREEEWLVADIALDVFETIHYARRRTLPDAATHKLQVTTAGTPTKPVFHLRLTRGADTAIEHDLTVDDHIWSSPMYAAWARRLLDAYRPVPGKKQSAGESIAAPLLEPTAAVLTRESQACGVWLNSDLTASAAHERAALILGAFGLREAAGDLTDVRSTASRMAAHLALAEALRGGGPVGSEGALAETILATLAGRQADAIARLTRLSPRAAGPLAAWSRALRVRNTRDWRILKGVGKLSLLERREHFRALSASIGAGAAVAFLEQQAQPPAPVADWSRIAFARGAGVEVGNVLSEFAVPAELQEIADVSKAVNGLVLPEAALIKALNTPAAHCVTLSGGQPVVGVLHWGTWAAHLQRELLHALDATFDHLFNGLGLGEQGQAFATKARGSYGVLTLFPIATAGWGTNPAGGCPEMTPLTQKAPELFTPASAEPASKCGLVPSGVMSDLDQWFVPLFPTGTAVDADRRLMSSVRHKPDFGALRALAPFDTLVVRTWVDEQSGGRPVDRVALTKALGPLAEYDVWAMKLIADTLKETPAEYRRAYEKIAALDPDVYTDLGNYLWERGLKDDGAAVLEKALTSRTNRVSLSYYLWQLADYHIDRGRDERGLEVAQAAADTGSEMGFSTLARMNERLGRYGEAEKWHRAAAERYEGAVPHLPCFYIRREMRAPGGPYKPHLQPATMEVFPRGLTKVQLSSFSAPPNPEEDQAGMTEMSLNWERVGLRLGDVVVALDGYRVRSWDELMCVRTWKDDRTLDMIVWRDQKYVEVKGPFPRAPYGPKR